MTDTELDQRLIASLTRLTAHLEEQNERIERLTKQLQEVPHLVEQVERLHSPVTSLTPLFNGLTSCSGVELLPARMRSRWTVSQQRNR